MFLTSIILTIMFGLLMLVYFYRVMSKNHVNNVSDIILLVITSILFIISSYLAFGILATAKTIILPFTFITFRILDFLLHPKKNVGIYLIPLLIFSIIVMALAFGVIFDGLILF